MSDSAEAVAWELAKTIADYEKDKNVFGSKELIKQNREYWLNLVRECLEVVKTVKTPRT